MSDKKSGTAIDGDLLCLADVATRFSVSTATVRNWIKTGCLDTAEDSRVTKESVDRFAAQEAGSKRLVTRANKLQKGGKNTKPVFSLDNRSAVQLASGYELSLSESYRNKEGVFYTPENIAADMLSDLSDVENMTFLEPCCGCGSFVMAAIAKGFRPENIYAFDTDETAVAITRRRIYEATGYRSDNIVCGDFLEYSLQTDRRFDCLYTNPPWGKKLSQSEKIRYAEAFSATSGTDTSAFFFLAGLRLLHEGGRMGLLLPEAFFNIARFEPVRSIALTCAVNRLVDYGRVFKTLITNAQAMMLTKMPPRHDHEIVCKMGEREHKRRQIGFDGLPKHIINFRVDENAAAVVNRFFLFPYVTLKGNARWAMGVVTGDNARHCRKSPAKGFEPVFRGRDISPQGFARPSLYIRSDLSGCQQAAPVALYKAKEKLVYRFISNRLVFYCDPDGKLILNSANLLILNDDFPISGRQLADLLNSDVMNWLYRMVFQTHKVLRGDLEDLPLPVGYFAVQHDFEETAFLRYMKIERYSESYRMADV